MVHVLTYCFASISDDVDGTVVSRNTAAGTVRLIRDGEGTIVNVPVSELICLSDVPFKLQYFPVIEQNIAQILSSLGRVIAAVSSKLRFVFFALLNFYSPFRSI